MSINQTREEALYKGTGFVIIPQSDRTKCVLHIGVKSQKRDRAGSIRVAHYQLFLLKHGVPRLSPLARKTAVTNRSAELT